MNPEDEIWEPEDEQLTKVAADKSGFMDWLLEKLKGESKEERLRRRHQDWVDQQERNNANVRELREKGRAPLIPYHDAPATKKLDRDPAEPWPFEFDASPYLEP